MSLFLSADEMIELTGKYRKASQIAALRQMGIKHSVRPDGRPLVSRAHVDRIHGAADNGRSTDQPNWEAIA
jgi:hypothetical protein